MGVSQPSSHAANDEHRQFPRQHPPLIGQLLRKLLEVYTADQLHRDKINSARFSQMIGLDDIGVNQVRNEFGFANKVINELLLVCIILANHFDGNAFDEATRAQLLGFVHHAHPALKDLANDLVMKLVLDGKQGHDAMVIESARMS